MQQPGTSGHGDQPGKTRTWWHPLLVRMLAFALDSAFQVDQEVSVGKLPLRVDILLIRREKGQLSEARARDIAELLPLLNRFTLIEFKSPTDAMEWGDFAQLVGCSFLWLSQQSERVSHQEISLIVVAPAVTEALREELRLLGCGVSQHESGILRVAGLPFATWLVETDVMAERGQPILSLVSRVFLTDRRSIIEKLACGGREALANYHYMVQHIKQFQCEEDAAMQQALTENLDQFDTDILTRLLEELPVEQRLQGLSSQERLRGMSPEERLRGISPEERLRGISPEERLRGISPEEFVAGLSDEETTRLRELLSRKEGR